MTVETHAFKNAFVAGQAGGYLLTLDSPANSAPEIPPYLRQKYDNHHLCIFVFETQTDAEHERLILPATVKIGVRKVSCPEIQDFLSKTERAATLVFLRDKAGAFALL